MGLDPVHDFIILVFCASLAVLANKNSQHQVPCRPDWYFFGKKCYKILPIDLDKGLNWSKSVDSCTLGGGSLASIRSNELQAFLTAFLLLKSKRNVWIGLYNREDNPIETEFTWVDGSVFNYTNWDEKQPTRKFHPKQEDCVEMRYKGLKKAFGKWNDEYCTALRPHICQVQSNYDTVSPDPRFCSLEDGGGWKHLNSCYHIVKEKKSWEDAEKYCEEKHQGFLVRILENNAEVFLEYIMKISDLSESTWIGIKFKNETLQKWTSGWHVAFKKYDYERFHFVNDTCAVKSSRNYWSIVPCHNKYPFICEKIKYNIPVLSRPPSDDWKCPDLSDKWLDFGGDSCYYIEDETLQRWNVANYECGKMGGYLASFHSENETNILHPHVLDTHDSLFIGLRRNSEQNNVFEWADGTNLTYQNWNSVEPGNKKEECGEVWTATMKWNDIPCNHGRGWICKAKKVFVYSKTKEISDHTHCDAAASKDQTFSGGIPVATVLGILLCTLLLGISVGVMFYHFRNHWMIYCTKCDKSSFTSTEPRSFGKVSKNVI